uniref:Uncharacterized protein n=1 Tax=Anguilla anguilla TaxID=7936 RepID=A0A0E9X467_ANGAN
MQSCFYFLFSFERSAVVYQSKDIRLRSLLQHNSFLFGETPVHTLTCMKPQTEIIPLLQNIITCISAMYWIPKPHKSNGIPYTLHTLLGYILNTVPS